MKRLLSRSLLSFISSSILLVQVFTPQAAKSQASDSINCSQTYLPVALAPGEPKQYKIYGEFCQRHSSQRKTVHVLVSGITYDHNYWDLPYQQDRYSYVKSLTEGGYATFNIDRIGIGNSSHPPSDSVTVQSNAFVLSQVDQALRDGQVNGVKFNHIINVGHSFGSVVVIEEAAEYGNVDGVIISSFLHKLTPQLQNLVNFLYPAQSDPRFEGENLPDGYLTTLPETRGNLLYHQSNADPQVISLDESIKQTLTTGEGNTFFPDVTSKSSTKIHVPVLLVVGEKDNFFCADNICTVKNVAASEAPWFSSQARLQIYVLSQAGHSVNLHLNASDWYKTVRQWSTRFVENTEDCDGNCQH